MDAFHLINRMEALVEAGNKVPLTRKVIVEEQQLYDIIDELRLSLPDDIREAQAILAQRDSLINDAHSHAQRVMSDAELQARDIVEKSDFVQLARIRAEELTRDAEAQADGMLRSAEQRASQQRQEADLYALDTLRKLDAQLVSLLAGVRKGIDALETDAGAPPLRRDRSA
jgi:vacuolar-type H+-ATPase subunit H